MSFKSRSNDETDGTDYNHTPALPEGLIIAHGLEIDHPIKTVLFFIAQENDVYCRHIALLVGKSGSGLSFDGRIPVFDSQ